MRTSVSIGALKLGLVCIAGLVLLGGCNRPVREAVEIGGATLGAGSAPMVDVVNPSGSVRVEVDERLTAPTVFARIRPAPGSQLEPELAAAAVSVTAEASSEGDREVLRVRAEPDPDAAETPRVHLVVRVPDTAGVTVRNAGGAVELIGVSGPLDVENGYAGRPGGRIEVRAGEPVRGPVRLTTSEGPVFYQAPFGSTGRFDIRSAHGPARFTAHSGTVEDVRVEESRWTGVLNGGQNPVELRSGRGLVRAHIIENPVTYAPDWFER